MTGRANVTRRRLLRASPTALVLGVLSVLLLFAAAALEILIHQLSSSSSDLLQAVAEFGFGLSFTTVGVVVARREPRNPMGWLLIAAAIAVLLSTDAAAYARLDYKVHHGALPLGRVAVLLSPAWAYTFLMLPLIILLFPDGRPGRRWRWPLRAYLALCVVFFAGTLSVAVAAFGLRVPVDSNGNLVGLNHPSGANAWFGPVESLGYLSVGLLALASVLYQVRNYRRTSGVRRQQLKWLGAGGATIVLFFLVTFLWPNAPAVISDLVFPVALSALPASIGVGILKYRLYEIDRLVSRTLSYAILTALLVGTFIGLIALSTNTLALSGRVGVAASTLAAAALFNPLRQRVQRLVDRRFNRARYDAEATVAAFSARLREAVELDAIRQDLLEAVNRAVQPTHASLWIKRSAA